MFAKGITVYQTTKILDLSILNVPKQMRVKIQICVGKDRKLCGKTRKCWLPAFSPFPTMFSKGFFLKVVKMGDCVLKPKGIIDLHMIVISASPKGI